MNVTSPEPLAPTRWGRYGTEHELRAVLDGARAADGPRRAMDVGCGNGRWALLRDQGWSVTCTDVDAETIRLCHERVPEARRVLVDPRGTKLPVNSESTGLLTLIEVRQVAEASWLPVEAARVLARGGVLVMTMQNPHSIRGLVHRLKRAGRRGEDLYRGPSYRSLRRSLVANGFRIRRSVGLGWAPLGLRANHPLVAFAFRVEGALGLRHLPTFSLGSLIAQKLSIGTTR